MNVKGFVPYGDKNGRMKDTYDKEIDLLREGWGWTEQTVEVTKDTEKLQVKLTIKEILSKDMKGLILFTGKNTGIGRP